MKDKQFVLDEIRRTAALNNGKPLGQTRFRTETGIAHDEWRGVYWARWGDALLEAGFEPLEWTGPTDEGQMFEELARLVRKFGRYPVKAEVLIEKRGNSKIPAPNVLLRRFGERAQVIQKVREFCSPRTDFADVLTILGQETSTKDPAEVSFESKPVARSLKPSGYVYLVKSGKLYKIGFSENHWRRKGELHKQTAQGITEIHTISAIDDAPGIEKYWHERFKEKRQHGEWFDLSAEDVNAFKKRKFM